MSSAISLICPIRGQLSVQYFAKDNMTVTEEARRVDCLNYLIKKKYPKENFNCETTIIKYIGNSGRNSLRADIVIYDIPTVEIKCLSDDEKNKHILLVAEIKRESKNKKGAVAFQIEPALRQIDKNFVYGVYWDDINRQLFIKKIENNEILIEKDDLGNLPNYGEKYRYKKLKYNDLIKPEDITATLIDIANVLRSNGVNDDTVRYRETVKLLLAKYIDEREARESNSDLILQVIPGTDSDFDNRVKKLYVKTARVYSKAKSIFSSEYSILDNNILREIVKKIQGLNLLDSTSDSMQQVFMTFVPAVFKKDLDQYFTPLTLVNCMVEVLRPGPNDKIVDPAMGTADFLTASMQYRLKLKDEQIINRVYGIDKDEQAFELAVINMILNKDGQTNLLNLDSIEKHNLWQGEMDIALCNPPFGSKTIETRSEILKNYDLGHLWINENGEWIMTENILPSQQLGILFIERCYNLLVEGGKLGIILPEGYLCTSSYGYVRHWIINKLKIIGLVELPRRIFLKSDVDLRSNVLFAEKTNVKSNNYPVHSELVRKVGYKLGKGYFVIPKRDDDTGLELRTASTNEIIIDTDFTRVKNNFINFIIQVDKSDKNWTGARINNILSHPNLDMKPRRLSYKALSNYEIIKKGKYKKLFEIAEIVDEPEILSDHHKVNEELYLIEGQDIRAVEGVVVLKGTEKRWKIEVRKSNKAYLVKKNDIVIGLVRPERRNIGLYNYDYSNVYASPDGVAIIREKSKLYPFEWLFQILRTEKCRLQFWTESGGTSYGKLSLDQINNILIPIPSDDEILKVKKTVSTWSKSIKEASKNFQNIWENNDKIAILNSPIIGLEIDNIPMSEGIDNEDE